MRGRRLPIGAKRFEFRDLLTLDGGAVVAVLDQYLQRALADCAERPTSKAPRKAWIHFEFFPVVMDRELTAVDLQCPMGVKLPGRSSPSIPLVIEGGRPLYFPPKASAQSEMFSTDEYEADSRSPPTEAARVARLAGARPLRAADLVDFDDGALAPSIDECLSLAIVDCEERPGVLARRKVKVSINCVPYLEGRIFGRCEISVPFRLTIPDTPGPSVLLRVEKGVPMYQPLDLRNPDQHALPIPELTGERSTDPELETE